METTAAVQREPRWHDAAGERQTGGCCAIGGCRRGRQETESGSNINIIACGEEAEVEVEEWL
jgi:hypothetical protein